MIASLRLKGLLCLRSHFRGRSDTCQPTTERVTRHNVYIAAGQKHRQNFPTGREPPPTIMGCTRNDVHAVGTHVSARSNEVEKKNLRSSRPKPWGKVNRCDRQLVVRYFVKEFRTMGILWERWSASPRYQSSAALVIGRECLAYGN